LWDPFSLRELTALLRDPVFRGRGVPRGDGRPVMLVPGFLSGDWAMATMHAWLGRIGYQASFSGIVFNVRDSEYMLAGIRHRLIELQKASGMRVSVVGHSRGGLLAKALSHRRPDAVEQVITLGAPLADWTDLRAMTQHAVGVAKIANQIANEIAYGRKLKAEGRFDHELQLEPVVPTTSIYTRSDEVVNFRACLRPDIPALPVWGGHNGLLVNPEVYRLLGRLLARPRRPE
jgi:pimeloyl-ACP methyl ester carboxylesterase